MIHLEHCWTEEVAEGGTVTTHVQPLVTSLPVMVHAYPSQSQLYVTNMHPGQLHTMCSSIPPSMGQLEPYS
jgi:hypothetical protein